MMRRYAIYQRVSTDEQASQGHSLGAMLDKCRHYIEAQEDAKLIKIYEDQGYSGTLNPAKRPALNQLLNDLTDKTINFNTVLVWKLDRLSRSIRDTLNIEYRLRKSNVTLESVTERIDTSSASGKMFFNTIASFAEFESAQIGERTWNAMSSKVGQIHLGGKAPLGYKLVDNRLEVDFSHSETVKLIFHKFLKSRNFTRVADYLNKKEIYTSYNKPWSHKKIKRVLTNPVYVGTRVWNRRKNKLGRANPQSKWVFVKEKTHEPLVSERVFERAHDIIHDGHLEV